VDSQSREKTNISNQRQQRGKLSEVKPLEQIAWVMSLLLFSLLETS